MIKMTFGRSRPSGHRGLTVSPIRRVAARCLVGKQVVTQVGDGLGKMGTLSSWSRWCNRSVLLVAIVQFGKQEI